MALFFAWSLQENCIAQGPLSKNVALIDSCRVMYQKTDAPEFVREKGEWWDVEITTVVTNTTNKEIFFKVKSYLYPIDSDNYLGANAKPLKIKASQTDSVTQILKVSGSKFNLTESSYVVKTELFNFDSKETVDSVYTKIAR